LLYVLQDRQQASFKVTGPSKTHISPLSPGAHCHPRLRVVTVTIFFKKSQVIRFVIWDIFVHMFLIGTDKDEVFSNPAWRVDV
jgi:hypothetical protein